MFDNKQNSNMVGSQARVTAEKRQSRRLLFALAVLLVGISVLLFTDRQFWFGSNPLILDGDGTESTVRPQVAPAPSAAQPEQPTPAHPAKKHVSASVPAAPKNAAPPAVAVTRSVLPPLNVEVVAGNNRSNAHPNTSTKLEITQVSPSVSPVTNAAGRESVSPEATSQATYPLLAQHMNVQGSVVLKALIGTDGIIQDLRVLSGPAILAAAAQQAVREWHFKPIVQDGQPVETMAKIVVNFSIKVADNADKTTLAESRPDRILILTR